MQIFEMQNATRKMQNAADADADRLAFILFW
jgi:hypothetical protein